MFSTSRKAVLAAVLPAALVLAAIGPVAAIGAAVPAAPRIGTTPDRIPASIAAPRLQAPESLRAFLLTFDPGAATWERFGHNALWIHDPARGTDTAYHYGLFDMSSEGFLVEFLQGRMFYSMGSADAARLIDAYRRVGRDVTVQELRLTSAQIRDMQTFLRWNLRPENRIYRYDYFRDNCSTRIRDVLDDAVGGRLRGLLSRQPSGFTYRSQAVALTAEDELLTTGMDMGLGPLADTPLDRWELGFIPMRLRDAIRGIDVETPAGPVPLVLSERYLPAIGAPDEQLSAPPAATAPRFRALRLLLVGLLVGGLLAGAGWLAVRPSSGAGTLGRWTLALGGAAWGLLTGLLGLVLLGLWTLTDHEFAWRNENLLQADPVALGLVLLVPLAVLGGRARRATRWLATLLAALSILGLLLNPLPLTPQANLPIIALALPIHLGLLYGVWRATNRAANHP